MLEWFGKRLRYIQEAKRDERGFTLIELLVVVIIIGILAAIAIPIFLNQRNKAYEAAVQSDLRNASTAAETCASNNNGSFAGCGTVTNGTLTFAGGVDFKQSDNVQFSNLVATSSRWAIDAVNSNGGGTYSFDTNTGKVEPGPHAL